jgi:hypothetical protein
MNLSSCAQARYLTRSLRSLDIELEHSKINFIYPHAHVLFSIYIIIRTRSFSGYFYIKDFSMSGFKDPTFMNTGYILNVRIHGAIFSATCLAMALHCDTNYLEYLSV